MTPEKISAEQLQATQNANFKDLRDPRLIYRGLTDHAIDQSEDRRNLKIHDHVLDNKRDHPTKQKKIFNDPYEWDYQHEEHLVVTGTLLLKNTDGFLSADLSKFTSIYIVLTLLYAFLCLVWNKLIASNNENVINL